MPCQDKSGPDILGCQAKCSAASAAFFSSKHSGGFIGLRRRDGWGFNVVGDLLPDGLFGSMVDSNDTYSFPNQPSIIVLDVGPNEVNEG